MAGKSIKANYIYSAAYQVLTLLTPLITTPYISRVLMADGIGTYSFVYSVMSYFFLFAAMGISGFGQREMSYFQDNRKERTRVFWDLKFLSLISVTIFLSAYIIMSFMIAGDNLAIYLIMGMYIFFILIDVTWVLAGLEDFGKTISVSVITRVLDIVLTFMFIKQKSDLFLHVFIMTFLSLASNLWLWRYIPEYIDRPDIKSIRPFRDIKIIWQLFIPTIAIQIYSVLDKTMIGIITEGAFENGYYEQAMKIARLSQMLIISFTTVMSPRIGYLFAKKDHEQIESYMYAGYKFTWLLGVSLCLGLVGISDNFVIWFFGGGFEKVSGLLKISSSLIISTSINSMGGMYLIQTKRENVYTLTVIIGAAVNFMLNIVLIIMFKSYGAAAASVIAETVIALIQLYILRKELSFRKIILSGKNYFISGIIMLIIVRFINACVSPSVINTFTMIFTGAFVYIIMLLILRDEFFIDYSKRTLKGIYFRLHG